VVSVSSQFKIRVKIVWVLFILAAKIEKEEMVKSNNYKSSNNNIKSYIFIIINKVFNFLFASSRVFFINKVLRYSSINISKHIERCSTTNSSTFKIFFKVSSKSFDIIKKFLVNTSFSSSFFKIRACVNLRNSFCC
jgi:hypothetical protein